MGTKDHHGASPPSPISSNGDLETPSRRVKREIDFPPCRHPCAPPVSHGGRLLASSPRHILSHLSYGRRWWLTKVAVGYFQITCETEGTA